MMHAAVLWLALFAAPFWEAKAPRDWSEDELQRMLHDSPWAQAIPGDVEVQVYLASARPIEEAERELARRRSRKGETVSNEEYADFLREDQGKHLVLAIPYSKPNALADGTDARQMQEQSILKVGKKKYKMTGYFPPTPSDPCLRLVFPRVITPADKALSFELYLPGVPAPYRMVEFRLKDLVYRGVPEM